MEGTYFVSLGSVAVWTIVSFKPHRHPEPDFPAGYIYTILNIVRASARAECIPPSIWLKILLWDFLGRAPTCFKTASSCNISHCSGHDRPANIVFFFFLFFPSCQALNAPVWSCSCVPFFVGSVYSWEVSIISDIFHRAGAEMRPKEHDMFKPKCNVMWRRWLKVWADGYYWLLFVETFSSSHLENKTGNDKQLHTRCF